MHNIYKVGGHCFKVSGSILCSVLERMAGFAPFEVAEGDDNVPEFFFMEGKSGNIPAFCERQYVFAHGRNLRMYCGRLFVKIISGK